MTTARPDVTDMLRAVAESLRADVLPAAVPREVRSLVERCAIVLDAVVTRVAAAAERDRLETEDLRELLGIGVEPEGEDSLRRLRALVAQRISEHQIPAESALLDRLARWTET